LKELQKEVPQEIAKDEKKAREFILSTVNEPVVDKLVAEFCEKNPQDFEVLNVFDFSDEELKKTKENIGTETTDGMLEIIKYEQVVNLAGLAYKSAVISEAIDKLLIITQRDNGPDAGI
jgi:hypothetical protein